MKRKFFPAELFFWISYMKHLSKCPYFKKPVLPRKIPGCMPVTLILTFHPNFHRNICVFGNLPIYRKLIHNNISLGFWKPRIFCLVLFWRRHKIAWTYKYQKLWLVLFWRRYILFLLINIGIIIFVSVILRKMKIISVHYYLCWCKIPKGNSSNSSNISDYVNIVENMSTHHYTRLA